MGPISNAFNRQNDPPFPWPVKDIKETYMHGESILHLIVEAGDRYEKYACEAVTLGADINAVDDSGSTPLHRAVIRGHTGILKCFIEALGPSCVNQPNPSAGFLLHPTLLHMAAANEQTETVKFLIEQGAILNPAHAVISPVESALNRSNADIIKILIEAGADIPKCEKKRGGSLVGDILRSFPMNEESVKMIKLLLDAGSDPDGTLKHNHRKPALQLAIERKFYTAAEMLLKAGANPNLETDSTFPPMLDAIRIREDDGADFVKLLLDHGANPDGSPSHPGFIVCRAAMENNHRALKLLAERGANIDAFSDNYHETPLCVAATYGMIESAEVLLDHGAKVDGDDKCIETPLGCALRSRKIKTALLLIKKGADIQKRNNIGHAPLDIAIFHSAPDPLIDALLEKGADPFDKDKNGVSAHDRLTQMWQRSEGNLDILRRLEKFERFKKPTAETKTPPGPDRGPAP